MTRTIDRRTFTALSLASTAALLTGCAHAGPGPQLDSTGRRTGTRTQVTILLYPGTTVLDWVGPYEALHRVNGVEVVLAGKTTDIMKSDSGIVAYKANVSLEEITRTERKIMDATVAELGAQQLGQTLSALAKGLPVFNITFDADAEKMPDVEQVGVIS